MQSKNFYSYFATVVLTVVAFLLLPLPTGFINKIRKSNFPQTFASNADDIVFGSSAIDEFSGCDTDKRSIVDMLAENTHKRVVDGSYSGQTLEEAVNLAALAARLGKVKNIIIAFSWGEILDNKNFSLHNYIAFRELNPALDVGGPLFYFNSIAAAFSPSPKIYRPFVFKGIKYPGLDGFDNDLFVRESEARTCPENDGHDRQHIDAIYFHLMMEYPPEHSNVSLIISLRDHLSKLDKSFSFVLLPINFQMLGQIAADWPILIRQRRDDFVRGLRTAGVKVLDLSEQLPNEAFIDRWCGCAHYTQAGRGLIVEKLSPWISPGALGSFAPDPRRAIGYPLGTAGATVSSSNL